MRRPGLLSVVGVVLGLCFLAGRVGAAENGTFPPALFHTWVGQPTRTNIVYYRPHGNELVAQATLQKAIAQYGGTDYSIGIPPESNLRHLKRGATLVDLNRIFTEAGIQALADENKILRTSLMCRDTENLGRQILGLLAPYEIVIALHDNGGGNWFEAFIQDRQDIQEQDKNKYAKFSQYKDFVSAHTRISTENPNDCIIVTMKDDYEALKALNPRPPYPYSIAWEPIADPETNPELRNILDDGSMSVSYGSYPTRKRYFNLEVDHKRLQGAETRHLALVKVVLQLVGELPR